MMTVLIDVTVTVTVTPLLQPRFSLQNPVALAFKHLRNKSWLVQKAIWPTIQCPRDTRSISNDNTNKAKVLAVHETYSTAPMAATPAAKSPTTLKKCILNECC